MASGQDIRITDVPFSSVPSTESTVFINDNGKLRQTDLTTIAKYSELYTAIIEAHNTGLQSLETTKTQLEQALVDLTNEKFEIINRDHTENLAELTALYENSVQNINVLIENGHDKLLNDIAAVDDLRIKVDELNNNFGGATFSIENGILYVTATVDGVEYTKKVVTLKGETVALVPKLTSDDGNIICSGSSNGSYPYAVFDQNLNTTWLSGGSGSYIGYNFNKYVTVSKILIHNASSPSYGTVRCKDFNVQYYDENNQTWVTCYSDTCAQTTGQNATDEFFEFEPVSAKQFRVVITSTYADIVIMNNLQFYGYEA